MLRNAASGRLAFSFFKEGVICIIPSSLTMIRSMM